MTPGLPPARRCLRAGVARRLPLALICLLLVGASALAQEIGPLAWDLPADAMLEYRRRAVVGGKPASGDDRRFTVFGSELSPRHAPALVAGVFRELPFPFLFQLPAGKIKEGQRWDVKTPCFERGLDSVPAGIPGLGGTALEPVLVHGQVRFKGMEKGSHPPLALLEGAFQISALKKGAPGKPLGKMRTWQWIDPAGPRLVRARYDWEVKGQEQQGHKAPSSASLQAHEEIELIDDKRMLSKEALAGGIHTAIDRGVAWMRAQQKRDGSFRDEEGFAGSYTVGSTSIVLMALLHSGVKPDDPAVVKAFEYARGGAYKVRVYDASLLIQAVEAKYLPFEKFDEIRTYDEEATRKWLQERLTPEDKALVEDAARWIVSKMGRAGTWGYPEYNDLGLDTSNTQYALLGLKSAARCGVKIEPEVWKKVIRHFVDNQITPGDPQIELNVETEAESAAAAEGETVAKGGLVSPRPWGYGVIALKPMEKGYAAMTCAGLTCLIVCESELFVQGKLDTGTRESLARAKREGLAYLQANFSPRASGPPSGFWSTFFHYYLYSVERVGVLYGIRRIGGHDWYLEGAKVLLDQQEEDGRWEGPARHRVSDTAFALLFLKKATLTVQTR